MERAKLAVVVLALLAILLPLTPARPLAAPLALLGGICLAVTWGNPFPSETRSWGRPLLQGSVVLLGLSVPIGTVLTAGRDGLVVSLLTVASTLGLGWILGRAIGVASGRALLISVGTAICGGSAIAAVAGASDAPDEDVAVAAATVFGLNALALLAFPPLGHALGMTPDAFGRWAGIAIHDVASVVGAAAAYDPRALEIAAAVKLSRVLFLIPIVLLVSLTHRKPGKPPIPWFVGGFLLASALGSFVPLGSFAPTIKAVAGAGFALALLGIGLGLSRESLRAVGPRPLALGAALWVFVSVAGYFAVR